MYLNKFEIFKYLIKYLAINIYSINKFSNFVYLDFYYKVKSFIK